MKSENCIVDDGDEKDDFATSKERKKTEEKTEGRTGRNAQKGGQRVKKGVRAEGDASGPLYGWRSQQERQARVCLA